jgi:hypothetical protein
MIVNISYNLPDELELYKKHLKEKDYTIESNNLNRIDVDHRYFLNKDLITNKALKLGLNKINFNNNYALFKTGEKNKSIVGLPAKMTCFKNGTVTIAGDTFSDGFFVWLVCTNQDSGGFFKTSGIVNFEQISDEVYSIETENSYYELCKITTNS